MAGGPWTQGATGTNSVHLSGLLPSTSYTFQMGFQCPGGTRYIKSSVFSTTARFGLGSAENNPSLVPNPGTGVFHLIGVTEPLDIRVYDITGAVLYVASTSENTVIDLRDLPAGIYFVQFSDNGSETAMQKLIIQH